MAVSYSTGSSRATKPQVMAPASVILILHVVMEVSQLEGVRIYIVGHSAEDRVMLCSNPLHFMNSVSNCMYVEEQVRDGC